VGYPTTHTVSKTVLCSAALYPRASHIAGLDALRIPTLSPTAKKEKKVGILYLSIVLLLITSVVISARSLDLSLDLDDIPSQIYTVAHVEFAVLITLGNPPKWAISSVEGF
jgi:hypothetical protein